MYKRNLDKIHESEENKWGNSDGMNRILKNLIGMVLQCN